MDGEKLMDLYSNLMLRLLYQRMFTKKEQNHSCKNKEYESNSIENK